MVLPLLVELSSDGFIVMVIEDGAATVGEAKVGGVEEDPFMLEVPWQVHRLWRILLAPCNAGRAKGRYPAVWKDNLPVISLESEHR